MSNATLGFKSLVPSALWDKQSIRCCARCCDFLNNHRPTTRSTIQLPCNGWRQSKPSCDCAELCKW
jgi:hypothetical protein